MGGKCKPTFLHFWTCLLCRREKSLSCVAAGLLGWLRHGVLMQMVREMLVGRAECVLSRGVR